nr:TolC family protein [Agitococcus sp.]
AQLSLVKAHSEVASQRGVLAQLLGVIPTQLPSLITIKTPENTALFSEAELESWLKTAISQRSEIKATKANLQAAEQAIISAKTALKPTVSVSANSNWQQNDSQATNSYGLGISVDVPFDLSGATQAKIQQSEIQKQQQETALQRSEQQIYSQVWQAFYQLQAALQTVDAAQQGIDSSQKAAQMASARYQVGLSTLLDVLTAQNQFTSQQQQLVAAQYDALIARNQLNYVLGQPINLLNTQ